MGMMLYGLVAITTIALAFLVINEPQPVSGQLHKSNGFTRRQGLNTLSLLAIFTILFLLSALRLEVGNDYGTYVTTIHEIYVGGYVVTEPLFNGVVKILCELKIFFSFVNLIIICNLCICEEIWHLDLGRKKGKNKIGN